jgi:uracil-DNA glycosylase
MEATNGNTLVGMVQAYHGRVYSKEVLESLSDKRLMSMIHPSDREYLADKAKEAEG